MLVCLCHGVSDRQIKAVATQENGNFRKVCSLTKACTDCGSCRKEVREICNEARESLPMWMPAQLPTTA